MGAVFRLRHKVGPTTHNERETAGIECGTDKFGDNVHGRKEGIKYRVQIFFGAPEKTAVEASERLLMC